MGLLYTPSLRFPQGDLLPSLSVRQLADYLNISYYNISSQDKSIFVQNEASIDITQALAEKLLSSQKFLSIYLSTSLDGYESYTEPFKNLSNMPMAIYDYQESLTSLTTYRNALNSYYRRFEAGAEFAIDLENDDSEAFTIYACFKIAPCGFAVASRLT